jgi:hypothetical protein
MVMRDATASSTTAGADPPAKEYYWRKWKVTVTSSGSDALSGAVTSDPQVVPSGEGAGQSAAGRCYDAAGNPSDLATASGIHIDKTNPTATTTALTEGVTYYRNQVVNASYSSSDALSLVLTCTGTVANDQPVDTWKKARNAKVTVTATDQAGNKESVTASYTVN